jgi:hypothetical protein
MLIDGWITGWNKVKNKINIMNRTGQKIIFREWLDIR